MFELLFDYVAEANLAKIKIKKIKALKKDDDE
jgi:hypothetical protein